MFRVKTMMNATLMSIVSKSGTYLRVTGNVQEDGLVSQFSHLEHSSPLTTGR